MFDKFRSIIAYLFKEWLLIFSFTVLVSVSTYTQTFPSYTLDQVKPIILLWFLFVSIKGVERSGFLNFMASKMERGSFIVQKTLFLSFLFSLFLSIDVALIALLPLILSMNIKAKKELFLLSAFMAHIGSSLTPFGTPQNLFIYTFYNLDVATFMESIYPFCIIYFLLFFLISFYLKGDTTQETEKLRESINVKDTIFFITILIFVIFLVLGLIEWYFGFFSIIIAFFIDKEALKIDYILLIIFMIFIAISNELGMIFKDQNFQTSHIFFLTASLSQVISNVPATLILHKFTSNWEAILWGSNVGGFGTPIAALANLITYRIYAAKNSKKESLIFLRDMVLWGFVSLIVGVVIYLSVS